MPRKGENIYKRKDKRWEGRYIKCRDENSRAIYGYVYGKSYLEVKNKLRDRKQTASVPKADKNVIFKDYASEWLEIKKNNVKPSSYARYNTILQKHILPVFGNTEVTDISNTMVQEFICRLKKGGLSDKSVSDILCILKSVLKIAGKNHFSLNVDFSEIYVKNKKPEIKTLTENEQQTLCSSPE